MALVTPNTLFFSDSTLIPGVSTYDDDTAATSYTTQEIGSSIYATIMPANASSNMLFGFSVASNEGCLLVGAPGRDKMSASIYDVAGSNSTTILDTEVRYSPMDYEGLTNPNSVNSYFGAGVAVHGGRAYVAANGEQTSPGAMVIWEFNQFDPYGIRIYSDGEVNIGSTSGTIAVDDFYVYAPYKPQYDAGVSYFEKDRPDSYNRVFKFNTATNNDKWPGWGLNEINYGTVMAAMPGALVVGDPIYDANNLLTDNVGSIYIYNTPEISREIEVFASDGANGDVFGTSVAANLGVIVVGAPGANSDTGAVYIYNANGQNEVRIDPSDGTAGDRFGSSVSIGDGRIVVGAPNKDANQGGIYIYSLEGTFIESIDAPEAVAMKFGFATDVGSGVIAVGAPDYSNASYSNVGRVYTYLTPVQGNYLSLMTNGFIDKDQNRAKGFL